MTDMNAGIGSRLRQIRKTLQLSQVAFAQKLGVSNVTISSSELGKRKPTQANIKLICLMFNVNERWLCTGEGPMFTSVEDAIAGLNDLIETFKLLQPLHRKILLHQAHYLLDSQDDPDLDPDPEPVSHGRPGYVINEEPPVTGNRDVEGEPLKKVAC